MHPWAGIKPSFMGNCKQSQCASWGTIPIYKSPAEAVSKGGGKLFLVFFAFLAFPISSSSSFSPLCVFSMLFSPLLSQGLAEIGRRFNESYSLSLSPPLYAAPWALVIRHRSFHELLLSAFWNNRKKNKAPLQLAQVIIGCYYSVGTGLGRAWCMSSSPPPHGRNLPHPPRGRLWHVALLANPHPALLASSHPQAESSRCHSSRRRGK